MIVGFARKGKFELIGFLIAKVKIKKFFIGCGEIKFDDLYK